MKLTKKIRDHMALATQELDAAGIAWEIEICKRHKRLVYEIDGKVMFATVSNSPSDKRSSLNLKSDVRNSIRRGAA